MSLRDQILNASTIQSETVEVPEWNGTFVIRALNAEQLVAYYQQLEQMKDEPDFNASLVLIAHSLVDSDGNRVLEDADVKVLAKQNGFLINRLCNIAGRVNRFGELMADAQKK